MLSSKSIQHSLNKANVPVKSVHYNVFNSTQYTDAYVLVLNYTNKSVVTLQVPLGATLGDALNILHSTNPELFI
jgi:hypothetical protein